MNTNYVVQEIIKDIEAQRKIGIKIPKKLDQYVKDNPEVMLEYYDGGMKIAEIVDLIRNFV